MKTTIGPTDLRQWAILYTNFSAAKLAALGQRDNDLAEAVRLKWIETNDANPTGARLHAGDEWIKHGALAFMRLVNLRLRKDYDNTGAYVSGRGDLYHIAYDPPPIPDRAHDWNWQADDYDGAIDSGDLRCGTAYSQSSCIAAINEMESNEH